MAIDYVPSQSHKTTTSESGPPAWRPHKSCCPSEMTIHERNALLASSVSESDAADNPQRFAVRRVDGRLEWYCAKLTRVRSDGTVEVHGFPFKPGFPKVPPKVARRLRDIGAITEPEYKQTIKS